MPHHPRRAALSITVAGALLLGAAACGDDEPAGPGSPDDRTITVYSGRNENLVKPVFEQFTAATGITVEARYGSTAQMAAQLLEEGDRSPADVFLAQDAGALGAVNKEGLLTELPAEVTDRVPETYRSRDGRWVGVTARSRVLIYHPDRVPEADLPDSVFDLTGPKWRGRVGVAPTNASFQAFVTAMVVQHGEQRTREFLTGLRANEPQIRENNVAIVEDVDAGTLDLGLVNHYYLGEVAGERGTTPDGLNARLHFFPGGDIGALVNVSGVGVLNHSAADPDTRAFVDYLLGPEAQRYFAEETFEYPVVEGVAGPAYVPALDELTAPAVDLNDLDQLQATIALIKDSGLTP